MPLLGRAYLVDKYRTTKWKPLPMGLVVIDAPGELMPCIIQIWYN